MTLLFERLTPYSLGRLLSLYEHRAFVEGVIWGINSFDQWGVELGKTKAREFVKKLDGGFKTGVDSSTQGLMKHCQGLGKGK